MDQRNRENPSGVGIRPPEQGRAGVVPVNVEELRKVLPGCVPAHRAKLRKDDAEETEILDFNPHEILFHLILAVQRLEKMIKTA